MCHALPQHSFIWISFCGCVSDFAEEHLLSQIGHELHESRFFFRPASPKRFECWKLFWFQPESERRRGPLPAISPDPLCKQCMDECSSQAAMWEGRGRKELFQCDIGGGIQYFCI